MAHGLPSSRVVLAAPMSFTGSAQRLWPLTQHPRRTGGWAEVAHAAAVAGVILLIAVVWMLILYWYLIFGLLLVPYRLIRRSQRRARRDQLQHAELLQAIERDRYYGR